MTNLLYSAKHYQIKCAKSEENCKEYAEVLQNLLPNQENNAGKYLTTDGINPSWQEVNLTNKANSDLSNVANISQNFKEQSVSWGVPDYDRAISITANTAFVAPFNGFIEVAGEYGNNGGFTVCLGNTIDKTKQILRGAQSGTHTVHSGGQAVIVKGQTYYFEAVMTINRAIICPCKGVN